MRVSDPMPATCYSALLILDADQQRAQAAARVFTLADYQPIVVTSPYQAWQRLLQAQWQVPVLLVGQIADQDRPALSHLLQRMAAQRGQEISVIPLPKDIPPIIPLRTLVLPKLVTTVDTLCAVTRPQSAAPSSLVIDLLPQYGFSPRVSQMHRSRDDHFRYLLSAARTVIGTEQWKTLLMDVGLAHYCDEQSWPPDDTEHAIPAAEITCLHQAVARSSPTNAVAQVRRWSDLVMQTFLQQHSFFSLREIAFNTLPEERLLQGMLNRFTRTMDEIRGEPLHRWIARRNGNYWLVHYSNLYVFGRTYRSTPVCHVWLAAIEALLALIHCEQTWEVSEKECSCQTQSGHCLFELKRRNLA